MSNGGWTDDGTVVRLTTVTDQVGVGTATPASTLKMQVEGRARISLEDKGGEVFNVMAYGAVGNGTTDDAPAVNSAIAAAGGGAIIYFPPGTYLLGTTISWTDKTLMFIGAGTDVTTINSRANTNNTFTQAFSFQLNPPSGNERVKPVVFRDMRIQFDTTQIGINFGSDSILIRQLPDGTTPPKIVHGFRFENCLFRQYQVGIKLEGNSTAVIENCIFWSLRASFADVWISNTVGQDSSTNMIRNCLFADPSGQATHAILTDQKSGGDMVIGCIINGYNVPIRIAPAVRVSSHVIIGNQIEAARYAAIQFNGDDPAPGGGTFGLVPIR